MALPRWRRDCYPQGLLQRLELTDAADRMTFIEVNGSFYSLQRPSSSAAWRDATPDGFVLALKGGRYLAHLKRLVDDKTHGPAASARGWLSHGPKLGPIRWQLAETLAFDPRGLESFLSLLPHDTDHAPARTPVLSPRRPTLTRRR